MHLIIKFKYIYKISTYILLSYIYLVNMFLIIKFKNTYEITALGR